MKGRIFQRPHHKGTDRWYLIHDQYKTDAAGKPVRKQVWTPFRGTKREADAELARLVAKVADKQYVDRSTMTLGEWLDDWFAKRIAPVKRTNTVTRYRQIIDKAIKPAIGGLRLQKLRAVDLDGFYAALTLQPSTKQVYHALLFAALASAVRNGLLTKNPAADMDNKPRKPVQSRDVLDHVWTGDEAMAFLDLARERGPQVAAFYALALDSGARRGELAGLQWADVNLDEGTITIRRTLLNPDVDAPTFGTTKTDRARVVRLAGPTVALLRTHKAAQAAIKLANRLHYRDGGLVFAKEHDSPGAPLQVNTIGEREFAPLCRAAGVKVIKFHGMRHTVATLMLSTGVPVHVVSQRLGHADPAMTLRVYAHALPDHQQQAADRLAALLHGPAIDRSTGTR